MSTGRGSQRSVLASALGILATLVAGVAGPQPSARADVAWVGPSPNGVLGPLVVAGDDGGNPRVLARPRLPSYAYPLSEPPMVAPGLGTIAQRAGDLRGSSTDLWVGGPGELAVRAVTHATADVAWSADGQRVAAVHGLRHQRVGIAVCDLEPAVRCRNWVVRRLESPYDLPAGITFAADQRHVIVGFPGRQPGLRLVGPHGILRRLTSGPDRLPQATPAGVLYLRETRTWSVRMLGFDGRDRVLAQSREPVEGQPSFDGRTVAISRLDGHNRVQPTELFDLTHNARRTLPWAVDGATFGADGRYLFGASTSSSDPAIVRYPLDGNGQPEVLAHGYDPVTIAPRRPS